MVARTCLNVTLYVPCRSCYNLDVVCSLRDTNLIFSKTLRMILEGLIELLLWDYNATCILVHIGFTGR